MVQTKFLRFKSLMRSNPVTTKEIVLLILGLLAGVGSLIAHYPDVALGVAASLVVWILNLLFRWKGIKVHRGWLTVLVVLICLGFSYVLQPALFPVFPADYFILLGSDPAAAQVLLSTFLLALAAAVGPISTYATVLYNTLLKTILDKLLYNMTE
jgi:hypothetical protein